MKNKIFFEPIIKIDNFLLILSFSSILFGILVFFILLLMMGVCNIWNEYIENRDEFGACNPTTNPQRMSSNILYWMTDRTPLEALISEAGFKCQFFRLVADNISVWFSLHNTPSPYSIKLNAEIIHHNKFH